MKLLVIPVSLCSVPWCLAETSNVQVSEGPPKPGQKSLEFLLRARKVASEAGLALTFEDHLNASETAFNIWLTADPSTFWVRGSRNQPRTRCR